jgi:hypothetical protein
MMLSLVFLYNIFTTVFLSSALVSSLIFARWVQGIIFRTPVSCDPLIATVPNSIERDTVCYVCEMNCGSRTNDQSS